MSPTEADRADRRRRREEARLRHEQTEFRRLEREAAWLLIVRILSFFLGAAVFVGMVFFLEPNARPREAWAVVVACLGPTVWPAVVAIIRAARGEDPPTFGGTPDVELDELEP
jgi:hypothetical protein